MHKFQILTNVKILKTNVKILKYIADYFSIQGNNDN